MFYIKIQFSYYNRVRLKESKDYKNLWKTYFNIYYILHNIYVYYIFNICILL